MDSRPRLRLTRPGGRGLAVLVPASCHVASDVAAIQGVKIVLGAIPRIRRQFPSLSARVGPDVSQHRLELVRVAGLGSSLYSP